MLKKLRFVQFANSCFLLRVFPEKMCTFVPKLMLNIRYLYDRFIRLSREEGRIFHFGM